MSPSRVCRVVKLVRVGAPLLGEDGDPYALVPVLGFAEWARRFEGIRSRSYSAAEPEAVAAAALENPELASD